MYLSQKKHDLKILTTVVLHKNVFYMFNCRICLAIVTKDRSEFDKIVLMLWLQT